MAKVSSLFDTVDEMDTIESREASSYSSLDGVLCGFLGDGSGLGGFIDRRLGGFFDLRNGVPFSDDDLRSAFITISLNMASPFKLVYLCNAENFEI